LGKRVPRARWIEARILSLAGNLGHHG
jgi:hypothetical protein